MTSADEPQGGDETDGETPAPVEPPTRPRRRKKAKRPREDAEFVVSPEAELALERAPRRALAAGAVLLVVGLGMVGIQASDVGAAVTLLAVLVLIYGVHTFGRLGPSGTDHDGGAETPPTPAP